MAPPRSTKGKVSIASPAQRRQTLTPTKKQSDSVVIPEAEAVKQMIDAQSKPRIKLTPDPYLTGFESNGWYTPLNRTEDLMPSIYQANKGLASVGHQISIKKGPVASAGPYSYISKFEPSKKVDEPLFYSLSQTDVNGPGHFSVKGERQTRPTNSNYGELGYIMHEPEWDPQWHINDYKATDNFKFTPMYNPHYPRERLYYKPDAPNVFTEAPDVNIGTGYDIHSLVNAKVGAGALTGLGVLAYPYLFSDNNEEALSEVPQKQSAIKSVSEPTLEQLYVSQGKPYDSRPPQSYLVEEDLDASQIPVASQRTNALIRDAYDFIHSNTPVETSSDNFTAPRELPVNGETLDEYNSANTPKSGVVLASDDNIPVNGPRVLNKPANTRKPVIVNKPQEQVTPAPTPVSAESALVQNTLSKEDLAKRDRAFRNAKYAALNANLAGREDALQRARYQSLMNSGLRGMSPSEAIKSGLLTPEQAYVLMRGPF